MKHLFIVAIAALCATQCYAQSAKKDTAQSITLDTLTVTAPAGPPAYRGSAARVWDIRNTRIALSFNMKEKTADAREWIKLRPYFYAADTLVLDAKGMRIDSVLQLGTKGNPRLTYTYKDDELTIHFGRTYQNTDSIELYLKYTAMPYGSATGGSSAITDDRGLYFINTDNRIPHKPAQIWTQGETESNSHWLITIDKPNTRFTTQIELTVPDSFVTLSNGALTKQVKGKTGMRTDTWVMNIPIQAYAVMLAAGKFSIVKDHWRAKEVNYYVEPQYAPYAKLIFNHTPEMIEYFSQITGVPYPWNKYSQVVVRDYVSGAMENTSASLFGEFVNQNAREIADYNYEDVVSHELFHQWFGDYVTAESWSNLTVNESFANYGEQLWRAHKYGKAAGDLLSYNDLMGYIGASAFGDHQLVRFNYDSREEVFDAISYNKGGAILRYLNNLMGDPAFYRAMNIYLTRNALHAAEAHNWRLAIEEATGQDWNWFFNEWYYRAGHPSLKVVYNYNDTTQKLTVAVSQTQSDSTFAYTLPLKAAVIYGNDKKVIDWNITKMKDTFTYAYHGGIAPVVIPDYTHVLPGDLKDGKKIPQWFVQFTKGEDVLSKRLALSAAGKLMSDSLSQVIIDLALNDGTPAIRRQALAIIKGSFSDKYHKKWTGKATSMALSDTDRLTRAEAYSVLGDWKIAAAKPDMVKALSDSSYAVAGAALNGINKLDVDTAYILAKRWVNTSPKASFESAIWSIIGKKGADEDIALYEQYVPYVSGTKKFTYAGSLSNYLKYVKSDASFSRGINVFTAMVVNESMKNYRANLSKQLFGVATNEKDNMKSDKKEEAETAKKRLPIAIAALEKLIASETDPENLKEDKKSMKEITE